MSNLYSDADARRATASVARASAQRFDWSAVVSRLEDAYEAMIAAKKP